MSNGEVKLGLYMTTGRHHGRTFRAIRDMVEKLLPNGEIKVTTPDMQDLERIVAELKAEYEQLRAVVTAPQMQYEEEITELRAEVERLKRERAKYEADCKRIEYFDDLHEKVATQKRVIEKLKIIDRDFAWHYEECTGAIDDDEFCDCGLYKVRSEIKAIEKGEDNE